MIETGQSEVDGQEGATLIKVCGLKDVQEALGCLGLGVHWLGLNFWHHSKRKVDTAVAVEIARACKEEFPESKMVGLFVNSSLAEIEFIAKEVQLDIIQLHGDETPELCQSVALPTMKAIGLKDAASLQQFKAYTCPWMLVDAATSLRGGSGQAADWELASQATSLHTQTWLAGGLGPSNIARAIENVGPIGVDVASGVEASPGAKDLRLVAEFVAQVRAIDAKRLSKRVRTSV